MNVDSRVIHTLPMRTTICLCRARSAAAVVVLAIVLAALDRFLLEYDDERSGTFEPLRHVPDDRVVVLGLVSTKKPRLETAGEVETRIAAAALVVPLERLALSAQCGFASTAEGNRLSAADQHRNLQLVADAARAVWSAGSRAIAPTA